MSLVDVGIPYVLYSHLSTVDDIDDMTFYVNGYPENAEDECLRINGTGGVPGHWYPRIEEPVQIISRSRNKLDAQNNLQLVYGELFNRFGLTLPSYTGSGGSPVYPAIKTAQISPMQTPGYIGTDNEGRHMWSVNFMITYKRE